ncbi:hypothetical protein Tco_0128174 [Tanacetum coccineum]
MTSSSSSIFFFPFFLLDFTSLRQDVLLMVNIYDLVELSLTFDLPTTLIPILSLKLYSPFPPSTFLTLALGFAHVEKNMRSIVLTFLRIACCHILPASDETHSSPCSMEIPPELSWNLKIRNSGTKSERSGDDQTEGQSIASLG